MREIKFRAWDLKSKSFYKPTYEAYNGKLHDISITLNGFVMERTLEFNASMLILGMLDLSIGKISLLTRKER
jgi:hypothetical protein